MSNFDWERKGPPRPGSSSMDHPRGIERPQVVLAPAEKAKRAETYAETKRRNEFASHVHDLERHFGRERAEAIASRIMGGYKPAD